MTGPLAYEPVPRSLSELLDQTVVLMRRRAGVVARLYLLPIFALELLFAPLFERSAQPEGWLTSITAFGLVFVPYIVLEGFPGYLVTWFLAEELSDHTPTTQEALARVRRDAPRIAWTHLLFGLLYVAGFAAFVLPILWVMLVYFVTVPVMCVENRLGWTALRRSRALMKGKKGGAFIVVLVWLVLGLTLDGIVGSLAGEGAVRSIVVNAAQGLVASYLTVFTLLFYIDLRIRAEAFDLELLARRVDTG
jgi:hypothetical protein